MKLTLTLEGPDAVFTSLMPLFARAHGWLPESKIDPAEFSRDVFARFLRESVLQVSIADAQQQARVAAVSAATGAADLLTLTLE